jgi:hypothetical protein
MALKQNVNRIDHLAIVVSAASFENCLERLTRALEARFVRAEREDLGLLIAIDWDAGLEILAPTGPASPLWDRLQTHGEGQITIIYGVKDLDAAASRAKAAGFGLGAEIGLIGGEPWAAQFDVLREIPLSELCGIRIALGQIEPREDA